MRYPRLTEAQQTIIYAVLSAAVTIALVLAVLLVQFFSGAWDIPGMSLFACGVIIALLVLLKELVQSLTASERAERAQQSQAQWKTVARGGDTLPHPAIPSRPATTGRPGGKVTLREYIPQ